MVNWRKKFTCNNQKVTMMAQAVLQIASKLVWIEASSKMLSSDDRCLYFNENLIALFHVDYGLIIGPGETVHNYTKPLHEDFDMVVGEVDCYLDLQVQRFNDCMKINQTAYVKRVLASYHMTDAKPISLPIEPGWIPGNSPPATDIDTYREIIGSLAYLTLWTRPDLAYAVNIASRAQYSPTEAHLKLIERIIRYLKGTINDGK
ncbi:uncharacterized protein LOC126234965 [Schistocerca nitens]|uniref:uncharacterized protein LOC126234965 n=1 Tax=Schistocerca nitens TaxID=7011 RepID=UPI0021196D54|nr:uncharacterized protein LOC126234965 [Schistocerca nitens]